MIGDINRQTETRNLCQPAALWRAVAEQMRRDGERNLSRWAGEKMAAGLDEDLREQVPERRGPGRPKTGGN